MFEFKSEKSLNSNRTHDKNPKKVLLNYKVVKNKNGKYELFDLNGKKVLKEYYEDIVLKDNYILVENNNKKYVYLIEDADYFYILYLYY